MAVRRKTSGNITVLQLVGRFYGDDETDRLREAIQAEAASGNRQLLLDLSECADMNSAALSVFVEAHQNYAARRGEFKLCAVDQTFRTLMSVTRLITVFDIHTTEAEAMAAFAASPTEA
jgi:anti-anti-sigma factor